MDAEIQDLTEPAFADADVVHGEPVRINCVLAEQLTLVHRMSYRVPAEHEGSSPPGDPEETLLRALFGDAAAQNAIEPAAVGQEVSRGETLLHHPRGDVRFDAAAGCVVESVDSNSEHVTVTVAWRAPARPGDLLEPFGIVTAVLEDGASEPRVYSPTGPGRLRVVRNVPTACQRIVARSMGAYDPVTNMPVDGAELRSDQLEWLADAGAQAYVSEVAAYSTGDPYLRSRAFDLQCKLEPITDGWSATHASPDTTAALFGRGDTQLDRLQTIQRLAQAAGLLVVHRDGGLLLEVRPPEPVSAWSHGEVVEPADLSSQKIFGPLRDYACQCGKHVRLRDRGVVCELCGVEVIESRVRRERFGHIVLPGGAVSRRTGREWSVVPVLPPMLRSQKLEEMYATVLAYAEIDELEHTLLEQLVKALKAPARVDYSGVAVAIVGERCRIPLDMLVSIASPLLVGVSQLHGYATTIRGARRVLENDQQTALALTDVVMKNRVVLLGGSTPALAARQIEASLDCDAIEIDRQTAQIIGVSTGDPVSLYLPISEAGQSAARQLEEGSTRVEQGSSWVADVLCAGDPIAMLLDCATRGAVDPCKWPVAAMLIGGYPALR